MFIARLAPRSQSIIGKYVSNLGWLRLLVQAMIFGCTVIVLAKWGTGLPEWRDVIASENGPVERMSAAIWFMGFAWCLAAACVQRMRAVEWLSVAMFLLLFGLRELDAHVWATGWNLDKLANYWNPRFPLGERLLVLGLMVLPCMVVGVMLCLRFWKTMEQAWRAGESWLSHLLLGVALLVLCLTLDKVGPYLLPLFGVGDRGQSLLMVIEEFFEFVLAVFSIAVLWPYLQEAFHGHE
ncbi:MAG: hypothetical protein O7F12_17755 [Nitrospirae bacterium]|nr:hypothetical protein [Nitrospirota bacterium]